MSSFQLEYIPTFRPEVAVILNITPDHLDRYNSFEDYRQAKLNITRQQTPSDTLVYNQDDPQLRNISTAARKIGFSLTQKKSNAPFYWDGGMIRYQEAPVIRYQECALRGEHNLANILAGLNAVSPFITTANRDEMLARIIHVLQTFSGIEHRLEFVRSVSGVAYYNDSKATNVDAVKYAIESFEEPVVLILGGYDKNGDFSQLIPAIQEHVKQTIVIGAARDVIREAIGESVELSLCTGLPEAISLAYKITTSGDVVLLAPACASFDQYENYEERGDHFKQLVENLD